MKKIINVLMTLMLLFNYQSYTIRQAKKKSFIRVNNNQLSNNNQNIINKNSMQGPKQGSNFKNNEIKTLPGFDSIKLLDPNGLDQAVVRDGNNNGMQVNYNNNKNQQNNNENLSTLQNLNTSNHSNINNPIEYNHHIGNSNVVPMTLGNQMNNIYNQNKQNEIPYGSAYQNYQMNYYNNPNGQPLNQNQPMQSNQQISPPSQQISPQRQQAPLPINNNNNQVNVQNQFPVQFPIDYSNNQNWQQNINSYI